MTIHMKTLKPYLLLTAFEVIAIAAGAKPIEIDPQQSKVEVAVSCTMDSFVGKLEKYQANVDCDPAAALPAKADVSFDFADLKTGKTDRDAAMLKWLQYDTNRTASFHLTSWQQAGTTNIAVGELTIHGVSLTVQMPVLVKRDDVAWDISGQATFDYVDFKLPKIRKALFLTVDPKLQVKFHLVGKIAVVK